MHCCFSESLLLSLDGACYAEVVHYAPLGDFLWQKEFYLRKMIYCYNLLMHV